MVRIFIPPGNFWSNDGKEAWRLGQRVGVRAILEFRIIWVLHWQTLNSSKIGDWPNSQEGFLEAEVVGEGGGDVACPRGLEPLPILA